MPKNYKKYIYYKYNSSYLIKLFVPELRKWFVSSKESKSSEEKGSTNALSYFGAKLPHD